MGDPATYRPAPGSIPESPGVYRFRDAQGRVVYVGKAKSLRQRLNSYFADVASLHPRTRAMVFAADSVDWVVVGTEVEALQLEYSWIKEYDPRFNVRYRDDKSYPWLAVTLNEDFPQVRVMRGAKRKGVRYFGPYAHAWAIRETVDLLARVFPVRTCRPGVFKRAQQSGRPCLLGYIDKCAAPCVGKISQEDHYALAEDFCDFMAGHTEVYLRRLEKEMHAASAELDFERAARLRDDTGALRRVLEKQAVVLPDATDADVVALAEDPLEAAVQVFHVRGGRVRGQRGWVVDKVEDLPTGELVAQFLSQLYGGGEAVPREVLVAALPQDPRALHAWLEQQRGGRVSLRVPQRGAKRDLMETVARNAAEAFQGHRLKRSSDLTARSRALGEIQQALGLDEAPLRIECLDVSQIQGSDVVAGLVVFEDGLARRGEYRKFAIRGAGDDLSAVAEVVRRRFARADGEGGTAGVAETGPPSETAQPARPAQTLQSSQSSQPGQPGRGRRGPVFAYPPGLLVIDGGAPQVAAAAQAMADVGVVDVPVCGLAKRLEEVWLPGQEDPVILSRGSEGLYLLQRVRDEAHRFAVTYHRQRRASRMTTSALDEVPGLGPARRKALIERFGSVRRIAEATAEEVASVPGIGPATAAAVLAVVQRLDGASDSDTATVGLTPGSGQGGE